MKQLLWTIFICSLLFQISLAQSSEPLSIDISARTEWISLTKTSAIRVRRALSPDSQEPIRPLPKFSTLSREFFLPSRSVVLGEPLLVEYRVSDTEESIWSEPLGGRYRGSGRDENFEFFLRHEDGHWVTDPYEKSYDMGGLSTRKPIGPNKTLSYWHPVQRWCSLKQPGTYRLYCLRWVANYGVRDRDAALNQALPKTLRFDPNRGVLDNKTGQPVKVDWRVLQGDMPKSPITIPTDLLEEMGRRGMPEEEPATYAEFEIVVTSGIPDTKHWAKIAERENKTWPDNRATAARLGLWYLPQKKHLRHLKGWLEKAQMHELQGLTMNPHGEAIELLLEAPAEAVLNSLGRLRTEHRQLLRPWLERQSALAETSLAERARSILQGWDDS